MIFLQLECHIFHCTVLPQKKKSDCGIKEIKRNFNLQAGKYILKKKYLSSLKECKFTTTPFHTKTLYIQGFPEYVSSKDFYKPLRKIYVSLKGCTVIKQFKIEEKLRVIQNIQIRSRRNSSRN